MTDSEWRAAENEFAVRIRPENMKAWFSKGINVDEGQTGLLFESGRFQHELTPGRQKLESLPESIRRWVTGETASAILIRRGLFPLSILGKVLTPEGEVSFDCEFGLQVGDRNAFYINLMQSTDHVTAADLLQRFGKVARQAIGSVIAACDIAELLNVHPELQQRMVDAVADALEPVAARWGMVVGYVSPPGFSNKGLSEYQEERAAMIRELRTDKLKQQFAEDKDQIEVRRFQAARVLADARLKKALEDAERTGEFNKVTAELNHSQVLHGLQLDETMAAAVASFAARQRERNEKDRDHGNLRAHLLAVTDIERQRQLATLKFESRRQSLVEQHELDELTREQRTQSSRKEMLAEMERLRILQEGQTERWTRGREIRRKDRIAETETEATTIQITGDAAREKAARDFDERHRQKGKEYDQESKNKATDLDLEVARLEKLSQAQAGHLGRLQDLQKTELDNNTAAEKAKQDLAEEAKDREHKRKLADTETLKNAPDKLHVLRMAELATQSPHASQALGDIMKMMIAKDLSADQLEHVMPAMSSDSAKTVQEKYRSQAEVAKAQAGAESDFVRRLNQVEKDGFERVIAELKSGQIAGQQQVSDMLDRIERSGTKGQELLRDIGVASGSRVEGSNNSAIDPRLMERLLERLMELLR